MKIGRMIDLPGKEERGPSKLNLIQHPSPHFIRSASQHHELCSCIISSAAISMRYQNRFGVDEQQ
jgi:hypothetical protein